MSDGGQAAHFASPSIMLRFSQSPITDICQPHSSQKNVTPGGSDREPSSVKIAAAFFSAN